MRSTWNGIIYAKIEYAFYIRLTRLTDKPDLRLSRLFCVWAWQLWLLEWAWKSSEKPAYLDFRTFTVQIDTEKILMNMHKTLTCYKLCSERIYYIPLLCEYGVLGWISNVHCSINITIRINYLIQDSLQRLRCY